MDANSWNKYTTNPETRVAIEAAALQPKMQLKQQYKYAASFLAQNLVWVE